MNLKNLWIIFFSEENIANAIKKLGFAKNSIWFSGEGEIWLVLIFVDASW